jgi:hypothetical protein
MISLLEQHFRLAEPVNFDVSPSLSTDRGYFCFGEGTVCYGKTSCGYRSARPDQPLYDVSNDVAYDGNAIRLPFDPTEVATNLRNERYTHPHHNGKHQARVGLLRQSYYIARPLLSLRIRSGIQKLYLRNWRKLAFPAWPVDCTVDKLIKKLLLCKLRSTGAPRIPFVWFWPDGASACAIVTHDVETEPGRQFCSAVMDLNDEFGIPASFQIVPERRYQVSASFLEELKSRGFEVNVQDLNHDGRLYWEYEAFKDRAESINRFGRDFGAAGFRAAILYRNQEWYKHLDFEYDMSVPNVAHLDPQRGGCCTVMPYFIGDILELPVTTTQDHSLFHILKDYSIDLWRKQIGLILKQHGLISFIVHPDYIIGAREQAAYRSLLAELSKLRSEKNVWIAQPNEVNRWWRARAAMKLVCSGGQWSVEGPGRERARVAFASIAGNDIRYAIDC